MIDSTGPHQVEVKEWVSCAPFEELLHMDIVEASPGQATLAMPFLIDFAQGSGLMHGGALMSLADTAIVVAIKSSVLPGTRFATTSCHTRFLRAVRCGTVTAKAKIVNRDDRTLHGEAILYNDEGEPVVEFTAVYKIARDRTVREGDR